MILNRGDCPAFVPPLSPLLTRRLHLDPAHLLYEKTQRQQAGVRIDRSHTYIHTNTYTYLSNPVYFTFCLLPIYPYFHIALVLSVPVLITTLSYIQDSSAYFERPVEDTMLSGLASSCMFLRELRYLQLKDVLADLKQLTAVHSSALLLKDDITRSRVCIVYWCCVMYTVYIPLVSLLFM